MYLILMVYACLISCSLMNKSIFHYLVYFNLRWTCVVILHKLIYVTAAHKNFMRDNKAKDFYGRESISVITRSHVGIHQPRDLEPASLDFQVCLCRCETFALQIFPNIYCYWLIVIAEFVDFIARSVLLFGLFRSV